MHPTLQQLEKRIRELVPSLQELSFGCEVYRGQPEGKREFYVGECCDDISLVIMTKAGTWIPFSVPRKLAPSWEIIGHPIQLHHVLSAIPNNRIECRLSTPFLLVVNYETAKSVQWNLTLPLSGQSHEVWEYLLEVIK